MIRVQVSPQTKAALQAIADAECRALSNLCFFVLERERLGTLQLGNDEGTPWAASDPVSPGPRTARINIRCGDEWKQAVQRRAATSGLSLSAYCNRLFERFMAAELPA